MQHGDDYVQQSSHPCAQPLWRSCIWRMVCNHCIRPAAEQTVFHGSRAVFSESRGSVAGCSSQFGCENKGSVADAVPVSFVNF